MCPFSGVTTQSWQSLGMVPESDARSVRCPFSGVTMQSWQSLGDGAGKRCSECDSQASVLGIVSPSTANMLFIEVVREEYN